MLRSFSSAALLLLLSAGCASDSSASPAKTSPAILAPGESLPPSAAWTDLPADFEPIEFAPTGDSCDGQGMWIGPSSSALVGEDPSDVSAWMPERSGLAEGIQGDVDQFVSPRRVGAMLTGSWGGPGGRGEMERDAMERWPRPLFIFDRRVTRERFDAAMAGVEYSAPIRIGGVDADGGRRCFAVLVGVHNSFAAANRDYEGKGAPQGGLQLRALATGVSFRVAPGSAPARFPGEMASWVHTVSLHFEAERTTSAVVNALALGRLDSRYAILLPTAP